MAIKKRRVIYLSDEEWDAARWNASRHPLSISAYIGAMVMHDRADHSESKHIQSDLRRPAVFVPTFRPAPKPGHK